MVTRYVAPIGTVSAGGNGSSSTATTGATCALNGIADLSSRGPGLSADGDTFKFRNDLGPYTLAEKAGSPFTGSATAGIIDSSLAGSLIIGSSQTNAGDMNGITFDVRGCTIDGRGGNANSERFRAFIIVRGERITWLADGLTLYGGNLNFLTGGFGVNLAATTYLDNATRENTGLLMIGNGNLIEGGEYIGVTTSGWCTCPLEVLVSTGGLASSTNGLRTIVNDPVTVGGNEGIKLGIFGGTTSPKDDVWLIVNNPHISDPCFGWDGVMTKRAYSALHHGNGIQVEFNLGGRLIVTGDGGSTPHITGAWQDGISMPGPFGVIKYLTMADIGLPTTMHYWVKSGSTWSVQTQTNAEGNGVKGGLASLDGTAPTTRLGEDGINGGTYNIPELSPCITGVKVHRCNGRAFTSNGSSGMSVISCEAIDSVHEALAFGLNGSAGNGLVQNSYFRLSASAAVTRAAYLGLTTGDVLRADLWNNIFHNPNAAGGNFDVLGRAANIYAGDKNLAVTGRVSGPVLPGALATQNPSWVDGQGLPTVSALRGAGSIAPFTQSRTVGCTRTATGARHLNPPNVGPY